MSVLGRILLLAALTMPAGPENSATEPVLLRRPTALAYDSKRGTLYVANERSGSISLVDAGAAPRVVAEIPVGESITDVAVIRRAELLALDRGAGALIRLSITADGLEEASRSSVPDPVSLLVAGDGTVAIVANLWTRSVTFVDLDSDEASTTLPLPFSPRALLSLSAGTHLIAADAFGGKLGVIDVAKRELRHVHELPAHNIRGLALSHDGSDVLVSHQTLSANARTEFGDVHWGSLMTNNLRSVPVAVLMDGDADISAESKLRFLGDVDAAAGDPAAVAVSDTGTLAVAFAGVAEVALGDETARLERRTVGRRPTALAFAPDGRLFVANTLSDTLSVLSVGDPATTVEVPLGETRTLSAVERGELLFYDAKLSHDGWLSCHSCHSDGHTNGLFADTLGDGGFGEPKRVLSLLGVSETKPWAWNGTIDRLEEQVRKSIESTMQGDAPSASQVADLTAFLGSLPAAPPEVIPAEPADRGREIFVRSGCEDCHAPPTYTSNRTHDVGITDKLGNTEFNPPSLRGVGRRASFFHDGRARSLEAVFTEHLHQLETPLAGDDLQQMIEFLRSL